MIVSTLGIVATGHPLARWPLEFNRYQYYHLSYDKIIKLPGCRDGCRHVDVLGTQ